ncbi:hypothetical protein ACFL3J_01500 [Candidatus Omnitrophota bacterium]
MNKKIFLTVLLWVAVSIALTGTIAVGVFNSSFAHNTIDYFSFAAGLFLIVEAIYKICRYKNEPYFPNQLVRHLRIIIGTSVFTIHVMQYVYAVWP